MSALAIQSVTGRIAYVGDSRRDGVTCNYSLIELEASSGQVNLENVVAANALERAIQPGRLISTAFIRGWGRKPTVVVLGIFDHAARRTFSDDQLPLMRAAALRQAILLSVTAVIWLPIAFLLFVVPGLLGLRLLWKAWAAVGEMPSESQVRHAVEKLADAPDAMPVPA